MLSKTRLQKIIGKRIRTIREEKGYSQEELAEKAGVYRTYVGHVEVGKYMPSAYTLYKFSKALGVKAVELLPF